MNFCAASRPKSRSKRWTPTIRPISTYCNRSLLGKGHDCVKPLSKPASRYLDCIYTDELAFVFTSDLRETDKNQPHAEDESHDHFIYELIWSRLAAGSSTLEALLHSRRET